MRVFIYHSQLEMSIFIMQKIQNQFSFLSILTFNDCVHFLQELHFTKMQPRLIILGIPSKKIESLALIEFIRSHHTNLPILVLVDDTGIKQINDAIACGVSGVMMGSDMQNDLQQAIPALLNYKTYFPEKLAITPELCKIYREEKWTMQLNMKREGLRALERSIICLLSGTLSYKEIGSILNKEEKTIEVYIKRICKKLNIDGGRIGLLIYCISKKFIRIGDTSF